MTTDVGGWIGLITAGVALATFWKSLVEFRRQGAAKRAEQFLAMRSRLRGDPCFVRICEMLETDSSELRKLSLMERDNFTGFFEELSLLWNSRVFNDDVVYYMFAYYALKCARSSNFWDGLNRQQSTWDPFNYFVSRLEMLETRVDRGDLRYSDAKYRL